MTYVLRLLDDLVLGHQRPEWCESIHLPGQTRVGYSTWHDKLSVFDLKDQFRKVAELCVPPDAANVAVHPALDRTATFLNSRLSLRDASGIEYAMRDIPSEWGWPMAVAFTPSGDALCLTTVNAPAAANSMYLLDTRSLHPVSQVGFHHLQSDAHYLIWHPTQHVAAIELAFEQEGTEVNLIRVQDGTCTLFSDRPPNRNGGHLAGFEPDGEALVGVSDTEVFRWSFPEGNLLGKHQLPEGRFTRYVAGWFENLLLVPTEDEDQETYSLVTLDAKTLKETDRLGEAAVTSVDPLRQGILVERSAYRLKTFILEQGSGDPV